MRQGTLLRPGHWIGALALIVLVAMAAPAGALNVIGASMGHGIDTTRLAAFGGHTYLGTFDGSSDAEWANALGGGLGSFDAIIFGENADPSSLSGATISNIASYVSGGGIVIVTGDHGSAAGKLNTLFGYSTVDEPRSDGVTSTLQPAAAGTNFATAPATITTLNGTDGVSGNPGTTFYTSVNGSDVFVANYGSGVVGFMSWDLCDCSGDNSAGDRDVWYDLLDRLLSYQAAVPFVPTEWLIGLALLMLLMGWLALRRRAASAEA